MAHFTPEFFSKHHNTRNLQLKGPHLFGNEFHSPKPQTVRNILAYSKALEVKPSESVENVMVILN